MNEREQLIAELEKKLQEAMEREADENFNRYFVGKVVGIQAALRIVRDFKPVRPAGRYLPSRHPNAVKH